MQIDKNYMKKIRIVSLVVLLAGLQEVSAQTTVNGTVVDKKGNPIQGALVEVKGSSDRITTDFDGGFRLDSVQGIKKVAACYVGMNAKVQKAKDGMVIKLSEESWWNRKPAKGYWFAGVQGLKPENGFKGATPGAMMGYMFRCGFGLYVKGFYRPDKDESDFGSNWRHSSWYTGKSEHSYWGMLGGAAFRIHGPLHIYVGAGYIERKMQCEMYGGDWVNIPELSFSYSDVNVVLDLGVMLKLGPILVNGGVIYHNSILIDDFTPDFESGLKNQLMLNVGLSYCF